jgi:hypothetical protein
LVPVNEIRATSFAVLSWAWWAAIMVEEPLFGPPPPAIIARRQFLSAAALLLQPSAGLVSSLKGCDSWFCGSREKEKVRSSQGCDGNRMIARYDGRTCPPGGTDTNETQYPSLRCMVTIDQLSKAKRKRGAADPLHQEVLCPRPACNFHVSYTRAP